MRLVPDPPTAAAPIRIDPDTGLLDRDSFAEILDELVRSPSVDAVGASLGLIEFDGPDRLDRRAVAATVSRNVRATDVLGLLDEQTIGVLFEGGSIDGARSAVGRVRDLFRAASACRCAAGAAWIPGSGWTAAALVAAAHGSLDVGRAAPGAEVEVWWPVEWQGVLGPQVDGARAGLHPVAHGADERRTYSARRPLRAL